MPTTTDASPTSAAGGGEANRPRSGADLVKATLPFQEEDRRRTWLLLAGTLLPLTCGILLVLHFRHWGLQLLSGMLVGLVQVRLFIFYHDTLHGALFGRDPLGRGLMWLTGAYLLTMPRVWRETHDHHHQNNGRQLGSGIGTFPVVTVAMAGRMTPWARWRYRATRHGLTMLAGCLTMMIGGMVVAPFVRKPRRHWGGVVAVIVQAALFAGLVWGCGWVTALCLQVVPLAVSMAIGAYLFYAQHNFPAMRLCRPGEWSYAGAALGASSMFEMGPLMRWFTGSIGYHHVHHLNHRIPFYRLHEAMAALPELQAPGRTSWRLRDIRACLALHLWDPQADRMLTRAEAG